MMPPKFYICFLGSGATRIQSASGEAASGVSIEEEGFCGPVGKHGGPLSTPRFYQDSEVASQFLWGSLQQSFRRDLPIFLVNLATAQGEQIDPLLPAPWAPAVCSPSRKTTDQPVGKATFCTLAGADSRHRDNQPLWKAAR